MQLFDKLKNYSQNFSFYLDSVSFAVFKLFHELNIEVYIQEFDSMKTDQPQIAIWRPVHHHYLEVIDAPPMMYDSSLHLHEDLEVGWKPGGIWNLAIRGNHHVVTPETVVITPPEEVHRPTSGLGTKERYIGLRFQTDFLSTIAAEASDQPFHKVFPASTLFIKDGKLRQQLAVLHGGLISNRLTRLEQDSLIQQLVTRMLCHTAHLPDPHRYGAETLIVHKTRDYIRDHYPDALSLQHLAQHVHVSAFHLNRMFTASVGIPPHAYQIHIRISQAKRLLSENYPIADVALRTGFASQSHFGECFKRIAGITPGRYLADCMASGSTLPSRKGGRPLKQQEFDRSTATNAIP